MSILRDRDYILDSDGSILRVIGDNHPKSGILSFIKYYPDNKGCRIINGRLYGYNSFACRSKELFCYNKDRLICTDIVGNEVTYTPHSLVVAHYSCRDKVKKVLSAREHYLHHTVGKHLIGFLDCASRLFDINKIGITGSFLFDAQNDNSDIDLVCYGREAYLALYNIFKNSNLIQRYEDGCRDMIIQRRLTHMEDINPDTLMIQESRKLQGIIKGFDIHINCQPLRKDHDIITDYAIYPLGCVSVIVRILDDREGLFSPAYYKIRVLSVEKSDFAEVEQIKRVSLLVSYLGDYAQVFRENDIVYVVGELIKISYQGKEYFGIELSRWDNDSRNRAALLLQNS